MSDSLTAGPDYGFAAFILETEPGLLPVCPEPYAGSRGVRFEYPSLVSFEEFADLLHQGLAVVDTQQQGGVAHPVALEIPFV